MSLKSFIHLFNYTTNKNLVHDLYKSAIRRSKAIGDISYFAGLIPARLNRKQVTYIFHLLSKQKRPELLLWTIPFLSSPLETSGSGVLGSQKREIKIAIQDADKLFDTNLYREALLALSPHKNSGDVEVLWRLSRAQYKLSKLATAAESERKQLIFDAYTNISQAMEIDEGHWAVHKWMSVLLDERSAYDGIKARISQLERVKNHMLRAAELNPKDATTLHMIGSWCYQIADMPWFQRKIAATIFAAPPTSTFEEALDFFSRAEQVDPRFYSKNLLMLGKTLLKLNRQSEAVPYLIRAKEYLCCSEEDAQVKKDAEEVLKTLKLDDGKK